MSNLVRTFVRNENGATAIEYGLLAALIAVAALAAMRGLGNSLSGLLGNASNAMN